MKKILSFVSLLTVVMFMFGMVSKAEASTDLATRAEAIVEIGKVLGLDSTQRATQFKDIPKEHYASGYIQSAVDLGIVNGYEDKTFKPNANLTRGHLSVFIARAFGDKLPEGDKTFKDVPSHNTSYNAVKKLVAAGITTGYEDQTFKPNNSLTKAHLKTFLDRTATYLSENQSYGSVKGVVTWQYNDFIGTKPDVGAVVFLIPTDLNYKKENINLSLFAMGINTDSNIKNNLLLTKVDGYGNYEITDVPVGEYVIVIRSKNTQRNFLEEVSKNTKEFLVDILGEDGYKSFELFNLNIEKYAWSIIEVKKDKTNTISKDFGNTYY